MSLDPAVAAVRLAVRRDLGDLGDDLADRPVLVACSGGADSMALLAAACFEARRRPWWVVGITVDHGLQEGSEERAGELVDRMRGLGAAEAIAVRVDVRTSGKGLEAACREARYAALTEVADRSGSSVVLLGHTLDDQAETVLLGLTRGSGGRSITGMPAASPPFRRPLLGLRRAQTVRACLAEGIAIWNDPHNADPRFTRARIRHRVMPVLERELGPGIAEALARTAQMLRDDLDSLDRTAASVLGDYGVDDGLPVGDLGDLDPAVRTRVLRTAALSAGAPAGELFRSHVLAVDALVTGYRGQRWVDLPGHVQAYRDGGLLRFRRTGGGHAPGPVAG